MLLQDERRSATPFGSQPASGAAEHGHRQERRALIVEDDEILCRFLERLLSAEGFAVETAHTGQAALDLFQPHVDIVLLDLNLPGMDGLAVLRALRLQAAQPAILVLTARDRSESTVVALESGADDYLSKPFSHTELVARLRALMRRRPNLQSAAPDRDATLVLHPLQLRATRGERIIDLTRREFALLEFLLRAPGVPVPRATLLREVWGEETGSGSNLVDVYMKYVRDKVDAPGFPKLVRTVRGVGYAVDAG